ncbi:MAG: transposase [Desulfosporosinus sp.]|nr:transposase [Desulfosporosinus sp.]
MPRAQRVKGEFSTYHVVQRGNEKKKIFRDNEDKVKFLETLSKAKEKYNFLLYAYCLMDNHIHLLVNDNGNDISKLMKSINVSYVSYFNRAYQRCGHLFQDRFKSEVVKDDRYLLEVSRYIHNNPVKAKMVERADEFKWSSYNIYSGKAEDELGLLDTSMILNYFSGNKPKSVAEYEKFVDKNQEFEHHILDIEEHQEPSQRNYDYINGIAMAKVRIEQILVEEQMTLEQLLENRPLRNEIIRLLRRNSSLDLKEIGELFGGISASQISRIAFS